MAQAKLEEEEQLARFCDRSPSTPYPGECAEIADHFTGLRIHFGLLCTPSSTRQSPYTLFGSLLHSCCPLDLPPSKARYLSHHKYLDLTICLP